MREGPQDRCARGVSGLRGALRVPRDHSPRLSRDGERQDEGTGTTLTGHLYAFSRPSRRFDVDVDVGVGVGVGGGLLAAVVRSGVRATGRFRARGSMRAAE